MSFKSQKEMMSSASEVKRKLSSLIVFGEAIEDQNGPRVKVRIDDPNGDDFEADLFVASMDGSGHLTLKKKGDQCVIFNPYFDMASAFVGFVIPKKADLDKGERLLVGDGKQSLLLTKEGDLKFSGSVLSKDFFAGPFEAPPPEPPKPGDPPKAEDKPADPNAPKPELYVSLGQHIHDPSKGNIPLPVIRPPEEAKKPG